MPNCLNKHTRSGTDFQRRARVGSHGLVQQCSETTWLHFHIYKEKSLWFPPVFHKEHFDRVVVASCKAVGVCLHLHYIFIQLKINMEGCRRVAWVLFRCCNEYGPL